MKKSFTKVLFLTALASLVLVGCSSTTPAPAPAPAPAPSATTATAPADVQKQLDDLKGVVPKFAIPMREVGDRFDNMYFAAKGGNWALAAYMSKYMNGAMKPASLTKPAEYATWKSFYEGGYDPINKALAAKDFAAFDKSYGEVLEKCNACHTAMGYKFIKLVKPTIPTDIHSDFTLKSEPGDVPK